MRPTHTHTTTRGALRSTLQVNRVRYQGRCAKTQDPSLTETPFLLPLSLSDIIYISRLGGMDFAHTSASCIGDEHADGRSDGSAQECARRSDKSAPYGGSSSWCSERVRGTALRKHCRVRGKLMAESSSSAAWDSSLAVSPHTSATLRAAPLVRWANSALPQVSLAVQGAPGRHINIYICLRSARAALPQATATAGSAAKCLQPRSASLHRARAPGGDHARTRQSDHRAYITGDTSRPPSGATREPDTRVAH